MFRTRCSDCLWDRPKPRPSCAGALYRRPTWPEQQVPRTVRHIVYMRPLWSLAGLSTATTPHAPVAPTTSSKCSSGKSRKKQAAPVESLGGSIESAPLLALGSDLATDFSEWPVAGLFFARSIAIFQALSLASSAKPLVQGPPPGSPTRLQSPKACVDALLA